MKRLKPEPWETRVLFEIENASGSNIRPMSMYATEDEIRLFIIEGVVGV